MIEFAAIEQLGVELEKIESIDMVVLMPTTDFEYGFSIRTKVPYELSALPDQSLSPVEKMTKDPSWSFRDVISEPTIRIMQQEPTRILLGTQGTLRRMTSSRLQTGGEFVGMVEKSQAILRIAVNIDPVRDAITDFILTEENGLTKDLIDELKQIIAQTDDALIEIGRAHV